jgi:hypothetical protein
MISYFDEYNNIVYQMTDRIYFLTIASKGIRSLFQNYFLNLSILGCSYPEKINSLL